MKDHTNYADVPGCIKNGDTLVRFFTALHEAVCKLKHKHPKKKTKNKKQKTKNTHTTTTKQHTHTPSNTSRSTPQAQIVATQYRFVLMI